MTETPGFLSKPARPSKAFLKKPQPASTNQALAQMELWAQDDDYNNDVYTLPKHPDEKLVRLNLDPIGLKLPKLSKAPANRIGIGTNGPVKPEHYRN